MEIAELLEQAKQRANISSDYALAKVLGIERQIISMWKSGKAHPSTQNAVQLATLAGLDEMRVIAEIELRTANSEKKKEFWKHYIESRGFTACLAMTTLAASIVLTPEPAEASVLHLQNYDAQPSFFAIENIHYAQKAKTIRLVFKALFDKWAQLINPYHPAHNYKLA